MGNEGCDATYNDLSFTDIMITDKHFLMHGRSNTIVRVTPPQRRWRRGQEANDPKKTDYARIWGITRWPTERIINKLQQALREGKALAGSDGSLKDGNDGAIGGFNRTVSRHGDTIRGGTW